MSEILNQAWIWVCATFALLIAAILGWYEAIASKRENKDMRKQLVNDTINYLNMSRERVRLESRITEKNKLIEHYEKKQKEAKDAANDSSLVEYIRRANRAARIPDPMGHTGAAGPNMAGKSSGREGNDGGGTTPEAA